MSKSKFKMPRTRTIEIKYTVEKQCQMKRIDVFIKFGISVPIKILSSISNILRNSVTDRVIINSHSSGTLYFAMWRAR